MNTGSNDLAGFGWSNFFQSQLSADEIAATIPARVMAGHRNGLDVASPDLAGRVPLLSTERDDEEGRATVGDWLLLDRETHVPVRLLERKTLFKRKAAGVDRRVQLIAANVNTLLIVSSCNYDFNPARLERYLVLARDAGVMPVIILTKADLAEDVEPYRRKAEKLMPGLLVECIDARSGEGVAPLRSWCGPGETVALVGSSGVGKSTLVNTLMGDAIQETRGIREADSHGRHTTTGRSLHRLDSGGWLLDTPGMRELQLLDAGAGVEELFGDILELATHCRFSDCRHETEPGCAVTAAVEAGTLDPDRVKRFRKLAAEEVRNSEAIADRRAREKSFGKMVKAVVKEKKGRWEQP
ncbi:MAG: ribosome small subunit-dependent GTPase A [Bauldia sp.]|nr:ribosome small subunit-dependent GTPase A [Bauldia sp.]